MSTPPRHVNCIAFDDSPFPRGHNGPVKIVGVVFANLRLDGLVIGQVQKDGSDATDSIIRLVATSKFYEHCNLIMLQGIAFGGFNVVDAPRLHAELDRPILIVARKNPDYQSIKNALLTKVPGGTKKWALIQQLKPMEPCHGCYIQYLGLAPHEACNVVKHFAINGNIPEPLRIAHLIAGALGCGVSKGRA